MLYVQKYSEITCMILLPLILVGRLVVAILKCSSVVNMMTEPVKEYRMQLFIFPSLEKIAIKTGNIILLLFLTKLSNLNNIPLNEARELLQRNLKSFADAFPLILPVSGTWHLKHNALCITKAHFAQRKDCFSMFP